MRRPDKNSVALAGEFEVLSQLALRGLNPGMTLGHTKGVDILVSNPKTKKMCRVEVKTKYRDSHKQGHNSKIFGHVIGGWIMSKEGENVFDPDLFYCFVMYSAKETKNEKFRFFVLPCKVVAAYLRDEHRYYLRMKKRKGKKTGIRIFRLGFKGEKYLVPTPLVEKCENRWDLVGASKNGAQAERQ
jgi:hypothetical protein